LGEEWAYYTDKSVAGVGPVGVVFVHKPRDAAKPEKSLPVIMLPLAKMLATEWFGLDEESVTIQTTQVNGATIHYVATPLLSPAWAFKDGLLYLALHPQTVASAAALRASKD